MFYLVLLQNFYLCFGLFFVNVNRRSSPFDGFGVYLLLCLLFTIVLLLCQGVCYGVKGDWCIIENLPPRV